MRRLTKATRQRLEYSASFQAEEAKQDGTWTTEEFLKFTKIIDQLSTLTLRRWVHAGQKPLELSVKE